MTSALLIIDVQQALCSGEYKAFDAERVIQRINLVSGKARAASAPVVVIQHESMGGPLDHGTDGWKLAEGLDVEPTDLYVGKKATDSFHNTDLQSVWTCPVFTEGLKVLDLLGIFNQIDLTVAVN